MFIKEIIKEIKLRPLIIKDEYGGFLKIQPNPSLNQNPTRFSLAYINESMAKFYGIHPRILGLDSHGHRGIPEPHLHGFTNKNKGYFKLKNEVLEHSFETIVETFYGLYSSLIDKYQEDLKMAKITETEIFTGVKNLTAKKGPLTLKDFHGNQEIYDSYQKMLNIASILDSKISSDVVSENIRPNSET